MANLCHFYWLTRGFYKLTVFTKFAFLYCGKFMKTRIALLDIHRSFPAKTESTFAAESIRFVMLIFDATQWRCGPSRPLGVQILSISCSFWENLAKSYVGTPPRELAPPTRGNPGPVLVTDNHYSLQEH